MTELTSIPEYYTLPIEATDSTFADSSFPAETRSTKTRAKRTPDEIRTVRLHNLAKARLTKLQRLKEQREQIEQTIQERDEPDETIDDADLQEQQSPLARQALEQQSPLTRQALEQQSPLEQYDPQEPKVYVNKKPPRSRASTASAVGHDQSSPSDVTEYLSYISARLHNLEKKQDKMLYNKRYYQARTQPRIEKHQHIEIKTSPNAPSLPPASQQLVRRILNL